MSQSMQEKYGQSLKNMMAIAGVANRVGVGLDRSAPVYDAWGSLYPDDAYCWLSKAQVAMSDGDIAIAIKLVRDALARAKTNRKAAEDALKWLREEYPSEMKRYS